MGDERDPGVDADIEPLPEGQRAVCQRVREILHAVDPEMTETIKRTVQPSFVLEGNVAALQATKDHVNVFPFDPLVEDPHGLISHGAGAAGGGPGSLRCRPPGD